MTSTIVIRRFSFIISIFAFREDTYAVSENRFFFKPHDEFEVMFKQGFQERFRDFVRLGLVDALNRLITVLGVNLLPKQTLAT